MTIDQILPNSGKFFIYEGDVSFQKTTFLEHIFINRDLPCLRHFRLFANPADNPSIYYRKRELVYDDNNLSYLWLTHILPFGPKDIAKQLHGLRKLKDSIIEKAKQEDLDFILNSGTTFFKPSLAKKFDFELVFTPNDKNYFYIIDLKNKIPSEDYIKLYQKAFPYNHMVRNSKKLPKLL